MAQIYKQYTAWNLKDYSLTIKNWIEKRLSVCKSSCKQIGNSGPYWSEDQMAIPLSSGFYFWDFSTIGRHVYPGPLPAFILHGLHVFLSKSSLNYVSEIKWHFHPQLCFYKRQRDFILNDSLLAETRAYQQLGGSWVLRSICLGMVNICLAAPISTYYLGQCLNTSFSKHIPKSLFRELHFYIHLGDQSVVPYGDLRIH